ncbi:ArsR/SmtB family transcription factor [Asticcacaulis sp.]|uniref:ArsR/SmtB family transcription factor n=1 Tax=Asticcacaulis sp. TaxID=1872648 RepID=UPI003F7C507A
MSETAKIFHALGDPTRRDMVERLTDAPLSVSKLAEPYAMSLTAVGQHLAILEAAGLVTSQKTGRVRTCALARPGLDALGDWLAARRSPWARKLDALGDMLDE